MRYYYTDPIKALYMMKEFGVKFDPSNSNFISNMKVTGLFVWNDRARPIIKDNISDFCGAVLNRHTENMYVLEESEHIFEPKVDDLAWWTLGDGKACSLTTPLLIKQGDCEEIIMRDGKHFFMPDKK